MSPIGVVLAGGRGRRMGGDKAGVRLAGRPLAQWVTDALGGALEEVVVACRLDTDLPALRGVSEAWVEREPQRGPLVGVVSALREARRRPVVCCALSLPLVQPAAVRLVADTDAAGAGAVVPEIGGRLEPLLARWEPAALRRLAALPADTPLEEAAAAVGVVRVPFAGADPAFMRVSAPEDLLHARAVLDARRAHA